MPFCDDPLKKKRHRGIHRTSWQEKSKMADMLSEPLASEIRASETSLLEILIDYGSYKNYFILTSSNKLFYVTKESLWKKVKYEDNSSDTFRRPVASLLLWLTLLGMRLLSRLLRINCNSFTRKTMLIIIDICEKSPLNF